MNSEFNSKDNFLKWIRQYWHPIYSRSLPMSSLEAEEGAEKLSVWPLTSWTIQLPYETLLYISEWLCWLILELQLCLKTQTDCKLVGRDALTEFYFN